MEHPTKLGPVVAGAQQRPKHDIARVDLERQQRILDRLVKAEACNHCPEVSTGTHKRGHHCELLPVHEGHDAVGGALSHLHKEREANQNCQSHVPRLRIVHLSEAEQEDSFEEECQELSPNAAAEAEVLVANIAANASKGSCKKVHQAEGTRQGAGITCIHLEVRPKMRSQLIVHCEFGAETCGILEDHDHDSNVAQHLDIVPHRRLLCLAGHGRIVVACRRHIPAHELHADGTNHEHDRRHHHGDAPSDIWLHPGCDHRIEKY
mmetsp:Transcript_42616/g.101559  ORF Transcript_42616/g.101559 Transcript_42616/m.101559 type:complete len:264 (+) Transcript_42616:332-1123(+)